jgi:hypothetical protein
VTRFTLTNMLVLVGILGVGMAAMRDGSELVERIFFTLMAVTLFVALIGAIVRRRNAAWAGFAVGGWGYAILAFVPAINSEVSPHLLTTAWLDGLVTRLYPRAGPPPRLPKLNSRFMSMLGDPMNLAFPGFFGKDSPSRALLSRAEEQALDGYQDHMKTYQMAHLRIQSRTGNAKRIGQTLLTATLALMGANLGRFLAQWRTAGESSVGPDQTQRPERAGL